MPSSVKILFCCDSGSLSCIVLASPRRASNSLFRHKATLLNDSIFLSCLFLEEEIGEREHNFQGQGLQWCVLDVVI